MGPLVQLARGVYRTLTYAPWRVYQEWRLLHQALHKWDGRCLFVFPHMGIGGAEKVHADIIAAMADARPLVLIHGFSRDGTLQKEFTKARIVVEAPHLLNHPLLSGWALRRIAAHMNHAPEPVVLGSLSGVFFDLVPLLKGARSYYVQHAFLHQPSGNQQHKVWLPIFPQVSKFIFVSRHAQEQFETFLRAHGQDPEGRTLFIPNAVDRFVPPVEHDRIGLLFLGRESPEKRLDLFLRIAQRVLATRPGKFQVAVVGPTPRPIHDIQWHGPVTDRRQLAGIMGDQDILLLTSSREGFPLAVMEAMAHGLVVVATPVGDVPNRLGEEAVITSSADEKLVEQEMAEALLALERDREKLLRMRIAAHARAVSEYSPETFRAAYRQLLASPASRS